MEMYPYTLNYLVLVHVMILQIFIPEGLRERNHMWYMYYVKLGLTVKFGKGYSKDRVKHDSFRVFNAFVTRSSRVCMKRVSKRVDSRFSRYKRVSQ